MLNIFGDSQGMMMKKTLKFLLGVLCCCILLSSVQAAEKVSVAKILEAEKRADKKEEQTRQVSGLPTRNIWKTETSTALS